MDNKERENIDTTNNNISSSMDIFSKGFVEIPKEEEIIKTADKEEIKTEILNDTKIEVPIIEIEEENEEKKDLKKNKKNKKKSKKKE